MAEATKCPICGRPSATDRLRPFCSRRCADVDLGRWFAGAYAVPSVEADDDTIDGNPAGDGSASGK